jgi:hypothetical protein
VGAIAYFFAVVHGTIFTYASSNVVIIFEVNTVLL